jgi:fatty acid desaturase
VPLSEHEQRLLEQIEQALYAEDPKFASIYEGKDVRSHYRRRVVRAAAGLVVGLGLLLAGVVVPLIPLGVVGFVVMLAAVSFGVASWQRMTGHRAAAARERAPVGRTRTKTKTPRRSVVRRLEDRWQRRQGDR